MAGHDITITISDGIDMGAYLAPAAGGRGPAVMVIQEIFGVNAVMRDICDGLAAKGFTAISPDLFHRIEPGVQLTDQTDEEWQKAFGYMNKFDIAQGVIDIQDTIAFVRGHDASTGKVGAMGYCLGGSLAYLTACRTDCDASVGYYPVQIEGALGEAANIKKPLMLHIATEDGFCDKEAQAKIHAGLEGNALVTRHVYEGQDHAFAREGGAHYDADAAAAANDRSLTFLTEHLA